MTTHISYKTAKMLKDFLGESAPEPMCSLNGTYTNKGYKCSCGPIPAYQLHDLLSKPFCEVMANSEKNSNGSCLRAGKIANDLFICYYNGGLPAVEKALEQMIKGER